MTAANRYGQKPGSQKDARSGEVLSPSQVRTFLDCQARWYFKYRERLPDSPRPGNMENSPISAPTCRASR